MASEDVYDEVKDLQGLRTLVQVMPGMSKAEILDGEPASVKPLDKVISE